MLPHYSVIRHGKSETRNFAEFTLHETMAEFQARPRVFTTFLAEKSESGYTVRGLAEHLARLLRDAAAFEIETPNRGEVEQQIHNLWSQLDEQQVLIRLALSCDGLELFAEVLRPRWTTGTKITLATYRGSRPWPEHKTTATEVSRASYEHALSQDAHEALLIDESGCVSEGSWSNFFWRDAGGTIYTRETGVLLGVTRQLFLQSHPVTFKMVTLEELFATATSAFITHSSLGATVIRRIDQWVPREQL